MAGVALRNGRIVSDGRVIEGDLWVRDGRIAAVGHVSPSGETAERELAGAVVLPGLIDLQVNGLGGAEVHGADTAGLRGIARLAPRFGCTGLLLTQISAAPAVYGHLATGLPPECGAGARVLGVHLEGPFLDPEHCGAHPREMLRDPSPDEAQRILRCFGDRVRIWTLAPERPGAAEVIDLLGAAGVVVAAGHSALYADEAQHWFRRGVGMVTHLFNAMNGLHHREPGLAAAALIDPAVRFSLIADGHHVRPEMVRLANRSGGDRLILVTDAVAPAGAPEGPYRVAGREVEVVAGVVRLADGTLAGSALTALEAVRNYASSTGLTLAEASVAMTSRPADLIGRDDLGRLEAGCRADFLILEDDVLTETWVDGRAVFRRNTGGGTP